MDEETLPGGGDGVELNNESYSDYTHTCSSASPEPMVTSRHTMHSLSANGKTASSSIKKNGDIYRRRSIRRSGTSSTASGTTSSDEDGNESGDLSTCSESWEESWSAVNERKVTEVTLNFFYQPRTLTLLLVIIICLVCAAFMRDDVSDRQANIAAGIYTFCFLFMSIGLLVFPNGPYTRPHPAVWRLVFGMSFLYFLFLSLLLFQSYGDIRMLLIWVDKNLNQSSEAESTDFYGVDCSITWNNLYSRMDIFIPGHFIGWVFKAILVRHTGVLWTISVMWECTELFFAHIIPNFSECWWDAILFDILLCNGCGIYMGMKLCKTLEVREFYWESIKDIQGTKGKLKRAVLQFTPQEWSQIRWMDPSSTYMRILALFVLIFFFQITELNTFLLKKIFLVPTDHFLILARLLLVMLIASPAVRQYYLYVTDKTCKRLGTQAWVYCSLMITELLVSIKFGSNILPRPAILFLFGWLSVTALFSVFMVLLITQTHIKRRVSNWLEGQASMGPKVSNYERRKRRMKKFTSHSNTDL